MKKLMTFIAALVFSISAMAITISEAVEAGKVKELPSGYVEAVDTSSEIAELVKKVNAGRKAEYERIAKSTGASAVEVGKASYQKRFGK